MAKSIATASGGLANQNLRNALSKLQTAASDIVLNSAGLAIKGSSSALAKSANAIVARVNGTLVKKAAGDMPALSGDNVADGSSNVYVFTIDSSGNLKTTAGTAGTSVGAITFPTIPDDEAVIGFILVENGTGSAFDPGTTALDTSNLTVTYINTPYPFNPNAESL